MAPETGALAEAPVDVGVVAGLAPATAEPTCAREDSPACTWLLACESTGLLACGLASMLTFRSGDLLVSRRPSPMAAPGMLAVVGLCGEAGCGAPHTAVASGICWDRCRQALTATEAGCIGDKPKEAFGSDMVVLTGESGAGGDAAAAAILSATPLGSTGVTVGAVVLGGADVADAPCRVPRLILR